MILVTVGTHSQPFNRLVEAMDTVAGSINEQVIIQRGVSSYKPRHAQYFDFTASHEIAKLTSEARVIVAHSAAGTVIQTLKYNKPLIIVPRLKKFGEANDDHQLQLASALHELGRVHMISDATPESLLCAIRNPLAPNEVSNTKHELKSSIRQQLQIWTREHLDISEQALNSGDV